MSDEAKTEVEKIAAAVAERLLSDVVDERRKERDKLISRGNLKVIIAIIGVGGAQILALANWKSGVDRKLADQWPIAAQRTWVDRTALENTNGWRGASVRAVVSDLKGFE
jgi:hypothetical protein